MRLARKTEPDNLAPGNMSAKFWKRLSYERELWAKGIALVAGVDEAGCGPLAGPVVAAAVVFPCAWLETGLCAKLRGLNDSKQLSEEEREKFFSILTTHPEIRYAVATVDVETIDRINIRQAAWRAMNIALGQLTPPPRHVLVDGLKIRWLTYPQTALAQGDCKSYSIAAASVLAKVTRDRLMRDFDKLYPGYGFAGHKGYGTPGHYAAIKERGACPIHRRSFSPFRSVATELELFPSVEGQVSGVEGWPFPTRHSPPATYPPPSPLAPRPLPWMTLLEHIASWWNGKPKPPHLRYGELGERAARKHLQRAGLEFLTANFRSPRGEVDLICRDHDCLVFIEVKTRSSEEWTRPAAAVDRERRRAFPGPRWTICACCATPRSNSASTSSRCCWKTARSAKSATCPTRLRWSGPIGTGETGAIRVSDFFRISTGRVSDFHRCSPAIKSASCNFNLNGSSGINRSCSRNCSQIRKNSLRVVTRRI